MLAAAAAADGDLFRGSLKAHRRDNDPLYNSVQPARQDPASEVVLPQARPGQEEDHQRADNPHPSQEAKNVQLPRVEGATNR